MTNFIKKIYICLFEPRKIGLFFNETLSRVLLQLLLCSLFVISPYILTLVLDSEIDNSSYKHLEEWIMEDSVDLDFNISNGTLTGSEGYVILINEAIVFINPKNEPLELSIDYALYPVFEFTETGVESSLFGQVSYKKSYQELGVSELDFTKMMEADYIEFDRFISVVNDSFNAMKFGWIIINSIFVLIDVFLTTVLSAVFLAFVVKIFNPIVSYRFRFKAALDGQFISLLFIMFMIMFNVEFLRYVGIVFSAIYVIKAMLTIVRVEVKQKMFSNKEGDDK